MIQMNRQKDKDMYNDVKKIWKYEFLVALPERHNLIYKDRTRKVNIGDIVMIKGKSKNRDPWKISQKVSQLCTGKDEHSQWEQSTKWI